MKTARKGNICRLALSASFACAAAAAGQPALFPAPAPGPEAAITVAGIPLGGTVETVRAALAAKDIVLRGPDKAAVREIADLPPAAGLGKSGTFHFHEGNLYKIKLFYTRGEDYGHTVYAGLKQAFSAKYGPPEVGLGDDIATIESVEWKNVLEGKVNIGLLWQADGRVTAVSYVFIPAYREMIESLSRR